MNDESPAFSNTQRANRAIGAMFFIPFGAAWLGLGASELVSSPVTVYALIGVFAIIFFLVALRVRRRALERAGPPAPQTADDKRKDRWFHIINAGQWVVILVTGNVLANIGLRDWILPMVMFVIGLHFLPLARLFGAASHYLTGFALIAVACIYPFIVAGGPTSGWGPVLAGLILWDSAAWALRRR